MLFRKPSTYQRFLVKDETEMAAARPWAFNQGFYNLFLAIGALGGLIRGGDQGDAIALFACACMAGAGIVLVASDRRMVRAATTQAVPPLIALVLAAVL
jgi:putative membrane protein